MNLVTFSTLETESTTVALRYNLETSQYEVLRNGIVMSRHHSAPDALRAMSNRMRNEDRWEAQ